MRYLFCIFILSFGSIFSLETSVQQNVENSLQVSNDWLSKMDQESFLASWDDTSDLMKITISKDSFVQLMNRIRKPFGKVLSRSVVDQRVATDPKGLPPGEYMVVLYSTAFSLKSKAYELVTLRLEGDKWKVLTYLVK